ncbi:MAG: nitroreductase [Pseudomonadota bacterium]
MLALLHARHSCRAFLASELPRTTIEEIVATAGRVPSWCNAQPWHVTVANKTETDRFRAGLEAQAQSADTASDIPFPASYTGVHKARRADCGWQLYDAVGIAKGDRAASARQMMQNFSLFGAPHVALVTCPKELGAYGILDCGAFVTAFTLAAQARGIASIPQAAVAGFSPFVRDFFGVPDERDVLCVISFGLEDKSHPANSFRTRRADLAEIMEWKEQ